jgi:hypothetical protein
MLTPFGPAEGAAEVLDALPPPEGAVVVEVAVVEVVSAAFDVDDELHPTRASVATSPRVSSAPAWGRRDVVTAGWVGTG